MEQITGPQQTLEAIEQLNSITREVKGGPMKSVFVEKCV
jgi:hypothetical protein